MVFSGILLYGAVIMASCLILQRSRGNGQRGPKIPTAGILPVFMAAQAMLIPTTLVNFGLPVRGLRDWLAPASEANLFMHLTLIAGFCALFSYLFYHPRVMSRFRSNLPETEASSAGPSLGSAALASCVFLCLLPIIDTLSWNLQFNPLGLKLVIITAIVLDILHEARAVMTHGPLVTAWEIHRMYALHPALALLKKEGIHAFARASTHRRLLYFFGPHIPVEIRVKPDDARRARTILEEAFGDQTKKCTRSGTS